MLVENQLSAVYIYKNKEVQSFFFFQLFNNKRTQLNFLASFSSETKYKTVKKVAKRNIVWLQCEPVKPNKLSCNICVIK